MRSAQAPISPSRSMKSIGFPYQNGKTMSDINKFFDDQSEHHNTSIHSILHNKLHTDQIGKSKASIDHQSSRMMFDLANVSQGSISIKNS